MIWIFLQSLWLLVFLKVGSKSDGLCTTTIDDRINVINGDSRLCNVRAQNHLSDLQNAKRIKNLRRSHVHANSQPENIDDLIILDAVIGVTSLQTDRVNTYF